MSEAKHTSAPWKWFDYPDGRKLLAGEERAVIHCPDAPMACDEADARLIAAAPDLLEISEAALEYLAGILSPCEPDCDCIVHSLRDVIAKAKGHA